MNVKRDVPYRGNSEVQTLPNGLGQGFFAMGAALVAVGAGSAGAAVLAMSLLASDLPNPMPEQEIIASAMQAEPEKPAAPASEPIFKDLIPAVQPAQANAVAAPPPPVPSAAEQAKMDLAALNAGDPRFAHDASAARGIEEVEDISDLIGNAFGPSRKVVKIPFDQINDPPAEPEKTAAVMPAKPAPARNQTEKAESSGKVPSGMALMVEDANIRSRPQKGAKVIGTVPARTQVQLVGCQSWCEIVVKGKRGYVWGDFVQRGARASAKYNVTKASAKADDTRKPDVVPASETAPHPDANRTR